jgi:hypothetical protein
MRLPHALESLSPVHRDERLWRDSVVGRSRFETRGFEALSSRGAERCIDQLRGHAATTMLLIHSEIRDVGLASTGATNVDRACDLRRSLNHRSDLLAVAAEMARRLDRVVWCFHRRRRTGTSRCARLCAGQTIRSRRRAIGSSGSRRSVSLNHLRRFHDFCPPNLGCRILPDVCVPLASTQP